MTWPPDLDPRTLLLAVATVVPLLLLGVRVALLVGDAVRARRYRERIERARGRR